MDGSFFAECVRRNFLMKERSISFSPPDITELEIQEVAEALRSR